MSDAKEQVTATPPDLIDRLQDMINRYGQVVLRKNSDGSVDVRAGSVATYSHRLRTALQQRVEMDVSQDVAGALEGRSAKDSSVAGWQAAFRPR